MTTDTETTDDADEGPHRKPGSKYVKRSDMAFIKNARKKRDDLAMSLGVATFEYESRKSQILRSVQSSLIEEQTYIHKIVAKAGIDPNSGTFSIGNDGEILGVTADGPTLN